jgi:hypothetical protein
MLQKLDKLDHKNFYSFFFYGSVAALSMLGIYTDLLAQRNLYTLLATVIIV